jgi:hypothetical protein
MSRNLVSVGKGLKSNPQKQDGGGPGNICVGNNRRVSGDRASKKSPLGKPDSTSRQDLLTGLPSVKRSPILGKWTELLDSNMIEDGALTEGMQA